MERLELLHVPYQLLGLFPEDSYYKQHQKEKKAANGILKAEDSVWWKGTRSYIDTIQKSWRRSHHLKICSLVDTKWSYSTSTEGAGARNSEHDFMEDLFESFYGGSRRDQQQSEERYYNRQADRTT